MTRDEAKQLLPVVQAWAEGKAIEAMSVVDDRWVEVNYSVDFSRGVRNYRVKPQPQYRPFKDAEECWQDQANSWDELCREMHLKRWCYIDEVEKM